MMVDPVEFRTMPAWKQEGWVNIFDFVSKLKPRKVQVFGDDYRYSIITSGRAFGKTTLQSAWIAWKMLESPNARGLIVGKTLREVEANNIKSTDTGLFRYFPFIPRQSKYAKDRYWNANNQEIKLPNGSTLKYIGGADATITRGYNFSFACVDEFAYIRYGEEIWREIMLTARKKLERGRVQILACSTPARNYITELVFEKLDDPDTKHIEGSMLDNIDNLDLEWVKEKLRMIHTPEGRLEVLGKLDEIPNALADVKTIRKYAEKPPEAFDHKFLSIDPAIEVTNRGSHTGIVLVGKRGDDYYILNDYTEATVPEVWAKKCVSLAYDHDCPILVETNQGGSITSGFLKQAAQAEGKSIRIVPTKAYQSKQVRAELLSQLLYQGRLHFSNEQEFTELVHQFCSMSRAKEYINPDRKHRDDRVDALSQVVQHMHQFQKAVFA